MAVTGPEHAGARMSVTVVILEARHHFDNARRAIQSGGFQMLHRLPHMAVALLTLLAHFALAALTLLAHRALPIRSMPAVGAVAQLAPKLLRALAEFAQLALHFLAALFVGMRGRAALGTPAFRMGRLGMITARLGLAAFRRTTLRRTRLRRAACFRAWSRLRAVRIRCARTGLGTVGFRAFGAASLLAALRWRTIRTARVFLGWSGSAEGQADEGQQQGWLVFHGGEVEPDGALWVARKIRNPTETLVSVVFAVCWWKGAIMLKKLLLGLMAAGLLWLGWKLARAMLLPPAAQVELAQARLLGAAEKRDWSTVRGLLADDYRDEAGNDRDTAIDGARQAMAHFYTVTIKAAGRCEEPDAETVVFRGVLRIEGTGAGLSQTVLSSVNGMRDPWEFHWRKTGRWPWDWRVTSIHHPQLSSLPRAMGF
jgi:hypothetical protein